MSAGRFDLVMLLGVFFSIAGVGVAAPAFGESGDAGQFEVVEGREKQDELLTSLQLRHQENVGRIYSWRGTAEIRDSKSGEGRFTSVDFGIDKVRDCNFYLSTPLHEKADAERVEQGALWQSGLLRRGSKEYSFNPPRDDGVPTVVCSFARPRKAGLLDVGFDPTSVFRPLNWELAEFLSKFKRDDWRSRFRFRLETNGNLVRASYGNPKIDVPDTVVDSSS